MSGWDKQINPKGDTLADELVDIMRDIREALDKIEAYLSKISEG